MALAHEIAVDKDFSLQKIQPANEVEKKVHLQCAFPTHSLIFRLHADASDNSQLKMFKVKEIMQKAFWDLLEQQLAADPPQYTQVDIKSFVHLCRPLNLLCPSSGPDSAD